MLAFATGPTLDAAAATTRRACAMHFSLSWAVMSVPWLLMPRSRHDLQVLDELRRIGGLPIRRRLEKAGLDHEVREFLPATVVHRTHAAVLDLAAVDAAELADGRDRIVQEAVGHIRPALGLDDLQRRSRISQEALPAFQGRLHEPRDGIAVLLNRGPHREQRIAVGRIAFLSEQEVAVLHACLLDTEWLGGGNAAQRYRRILNEGLVVAGVGRHLIVAEAVFVLHPEPVAAAAKRADKNCAALQRRD